MRCTADTVQRGCTADRVNAAVTSDDKQAGHQRKAVDNGNRQGDKQNGGSFQSVGVVQSGILQNNN